MGDPNYFMVGGGNEVLDPLEISSQSQATLFRWLKGRHETLPLVVGADIDKWLDSSGNAAEFIEGNGGVWAQKVAPFTIGNRFPSVRWDASNPAKLFEASSVSTFNFLHESKGSVLLLFMIEVDADDLQILIDNSNVSGLNRGVNVYWANRSAQSEDSAITIVVRRGVNGTFTFAKVSDNLDALPNVWNLYIAAWDCNGTTNAMKILINGKKYLVSRSSAPNTGNALDLSLGRMSNNTSTFRYQGVMQEVQIWNGEINDNDIALLTAYINSKYGLSF